MPGIALPDESGQQRDIAMYLAARMLFGTSTRSVWAMGSIGAPAATTDHGGMSEGDLSHARDAATRVHTESPTGESLSASRRAESGKFQETGWSDGNRWGLMGPMVTYGVIPFHVFI